MVAAELDWGDGKEFFFVGDFVVSSSYTRTVPVFYLIDDGIKLG